MDYFIATVPTLRFQYEAKCQLPLPTHSNSFQPPIERLTPLSSAFYTTSLGQLFVKTKLLQRRDVHQESNHPILPTTSSESLQTKEPKQGKETTCGHYVILQATAKSRMCKAAVAQQEAFNCQPKTTHGQHWMNRNQVRGAQAATSDTLGNTQDPRHKRKQGIRSHWERRGIILFRYKFSASTG